MDTTSVTEPTPWISNMVVIAKPDKAWYWLPKHKEAVQEIKRMITDTPVLKYYGTDKLVTIQSNASKYGQGCCLLQQIQPVAFASWALTCTEQNYAQIKKKCLLFTSQRFHHYLYGRETITAETDHKTLSLRKYWPFRDELNIQNGVLFRGQCVIIPKALRAEMLTRIHATHIGGEGCYRSMASNSPLAKHTHRGIRQQSCTVTHVL